MNSSIKTTSVRRGTLGTIALDFLIPICCLLLITLLFRFTELDLSLQSVFYHPEKGWYFAGQPLWNFLYRFGTIPALILAIGSLLFILSSFIISKMRSYRKRSFFFVLLMLIGPGLLVNVIFKDHWGRPRPWDVNIFGGTEPFHQVWQKGKAGEGHSFPSGHASMGFFWLAPFFILRRSRKTSACLYLAGGLGYGCLMGLGRMIQGAHFASDVVWAAGFVYLTGLSLYYLMGLHSESDS